MRSLVYCLLYFIVFLLTATVGQEKQVYTDAEARKELLKGNILVRKPYPYISLENISRDVVDHLLKLTSNSKCPVVLKGMTNEGSEEKGVEVRINLHGCVNNYITRNFMKLEEDKKNEVSFRDEDGNTYTIERSSWLVQFHV